MTDLSQKDHVSETPEKSSSKSFEERLKQFQQAHPYLTDVADFVLDLYAVRKADSKDLGRVMEARKRRTGR